MSNPSGIREHLNLLDAIDGNVWAYRRTPHRIRRHRHTELEFNLTTQGSATYLVGDRRYNLSPGTLIWLYPGEDHLLIDASPEFGMWIAVFKPGLVAHACQTETSRQLGLDVPVDRISKQFASPARRQLSSLVSNVVAARSSLDLFNSGLRYLLLSAWEAFRSAESSKDAPGVHPAIEKAVHLLTKDPQTTSLDELANRCGLSPSHLSRLFKQQTGVALATYRNRQRLDRFLEIYDLGRRRNITDAALEAGFGSYPQFYRIFKQLMGCSPAEFRSRLSQGPGSAESNQPDLTDD